MTKAEVVSKIASERGLTKKEVEGVLSSFAGILKNVKDTGDKITYPEIGTFAAVQKAERMARNPKSGEQIVVPAKVKLVFKAAPSLK